LLCEGVNHFVLHVYAHQTRDGVPGRNPRSGTAFHTVLSGAGHFLLQKARPPYETIEDVVLVEVQAGETFVVPPDYGHLQINPAAEPLVSSYAVMDGMKGQYEPFEARRGAIYYEMADEDDRYVFNPRYDARVPLRVLRAANLCQLPELNENVTYQAIRDRLPELPFLTDPAVFPESARRLVSSAVLSGRFSARLSCSPASRARWYSSIVCVSKNSISFQSPWRIVPDDRPPRKWGFVRAECQNSAPRSYIHSSNSSRISWTPMQYPT